LYLLITFHKVASLAGGPEIYHTNFTPTLHHKWKLFYDKTNLSLVNFFKIDFNKDNSSEKNCPLFKQEQQSEGCSVKQNFLPISQKWADYDFLG
jgi:hypothetical protein